jgi:hypothetical protein
LSHRQQQEGGPREHQLHTDPLQRRPVGAAGGMLRAARFKALFWPGSNPPSPLPPPAAGQHPLHRGAVLHLHHSVHHLLRHLRVRDLPHPRRDPPHGCGSRGVLARGWGRGPPAEGGAAGGEASRAARSAALQAASLLTARLTAPQSSARSCWRARAPASPAPSPSSATGATACST